MKKLNGLYTSVLTLLLLLTSCTTQTNDADYAQIDAEKTIINSSLVLTKAYNDTLKMIYDTVKVHKNNAYCLKYDKLYHKNDSLFLKHYNMFGDMMFTNGIMMSNYTQGTGMMQNMGTMGSGMDMNRMKSDTATVGGYYRTMSTTRAANQIYHNGIYN